MSRYQIGILHIFFFHSVACLFIVLALSIEIISYILVKSGLSMFFTHGLCFGVLYTKYLRLTQHYRDFASRSLIVLGLIFGSLIPFELIIADDVMYGIRFIILHVVPVPLNCFCTFVKKELSLFVWVYFWIPYSILFISLSLHQYHTVLITVALLVSLEIR